MQVSRSLPAPRLIALDMDGTLLSTGGLVSQRNQDALRAARDAGIEIVIATGRRHCYAMRQLRALELPSEDVLVSSNGAVSRTLSASLLHRSHLSRSASERLFAHVGEFRNALVVTFDCVGPDGEDERGALVVEELDQLHSSIGKWMAANDPYILHLHPIERALDRGDPIQMMLCGTVERMRRAETLLRSMPGVSPAEPSPAQPGDAPVEITLHRTEYPDRDLSIVDILPAGVSKGSALHRLAASRGFGDAEMMAIGDNWNDLPMLEIAGYPVLMGNAPAPLLALARERGWHITAGNDQDGVALAIEAALPRLPSAVADSSRFATTP